jgi:hypothetical protein
MPKVVVVAVKEGDDLPFSFIVLDGYFYFSIGIKSWTYATSTLTLGLAGQIPCQFTSNPLLACCAKKL